MTLNQLQDRILIEMRSEALRATIKARRHNFCQEELFLLLYRLSPTFEERIENLQLLSDLLSDTKQKALIRQYIDYEHKKLDRLQEQDRRCFFDVIPFEPEWESSQRFACYSIADAENFMELYIQWAEAETDRENRSFKLIKRKILPYAEVSDTEFLDEIATAWYDGFGKMVSIDTWQIQAPAGKDEQAVDFSNVRYPVFLEHLDLVSYTDETGKRMHGIILLPSENAFLGKATVLPLENRLFDGKEPLEANAVCEAVYEIDYDRIEPADPEKTEPQICAKYRSYKTRVSEVAGDGRR